MRRRELPPEYKKIQEMVIGYISNTKLNPFPACFEMVSYEEINALASYTGFPSRYPHWRFGMDYVRNTNMYRYGMQHIYEMVINNNPAYAYLLEGSELAIVKAVIAHVYGHSDFFRNNYVFAPTDRNFINKMGSHAAIIRKIINKQGIEKVEAFIDSCLMIEDLIEPNYPFLPVKRKERRPIFEKMKEAAEVPRFRSKDYMDKYINPPEFLEEQKKKIEDAKKGIKAKLAHPDKNIMLFLLENAPLKQWEEKILAIMLEEAYYFLPQKQTKIMNEGWATYWHSKIMMEYLLKPENIMDQDELITYCDWNSKIIPKSRKNLNPYRLGLDLFRDIEFRWNTGRHGKAYEECDDMHHKSQWDTREGKGLEKMFLVRECHNDLTFLDEFFTFEFARENKYFVHERKEGLTYITSREFEDIKRVLMDRFTNFGLPFIYIVNSNFQNRGELHLYHKWTGMPLRKDFAETTLKNIARIWKRPVNLETLEDDEPVLITTDGEKIERKNAKSKK